MDELESKFIPLKEVIELESNSKEHDLGSIHSSVERFGFLERIIINKRTGKLIAGHGRLHTIQQLKESGEDAPKGIRVDNGNWMIPADYVDVDEDDEVAASIALNKLVELGGWNEPKLVDNLIAIAGADGSGLKGTGFDGDELDALIRMHRPELIETPEDPGAQIDKAAELQEKWQVERGQIWEIGRHRLMCGDSTTNDIETLMAGEKALLMVTDPPYGDSWVQKARDMHERGYVHSRAVTRAAIEADDLSIEDLEEFIIQWLKIAVDYALVSPACVYVWHRAKRTLFENCLIASGFHVHQPVIWVKPSFVIGRLHYHPRCEWALHGWLKGNGRPEFLGERNQSDVWEIDRESGWEHPTQKPVELYERPMKNHLHKSGIAYDPFVGSGTALVAAEQSGCRCFGCELIEEYCSITLERMSGMGLEPKLIDS